MGAPVSKRGVDEEKRREEKRKKRIFLQGRLLILSLLVDSHLQLSKLKLLITGLIQTVSVYSPFLF